MPDGLNRELLFNLLYVMAHEPELHFSTASKQGQTRTYG